MGKCPNCGIELEIVMKAAKRPHAIRVGVEEGLGDLLPMVEISEEPRLIRIKPRRFISDTAAFSKICRVVEDHGGVYAKGDGFWQISK